MAFFLSAPISSENYFPFQKIKYICTNDLQKKKRNQLQLVMPYFFLQRHLKFSSPLARCPSQAGQNLLEDRFRDRYLRARAPAKKIAFTEKFNSKKQRKAKVEINEFHPGRYAEEERVSHWRFSGRIKKIRKIGRQDKPEVFVKKFGVAQNTFRWQTLKK